MNRYYEFSDKYKSLHNIFFNGDYYTVLEIVNSKNLSDKIKVKLIKENL